MELEKLGTPAFWDQIQSNPMVIAKAVAEIDLVDMERTLQTHPALRAWINAAHETTRIEEERAKWELSKTRAEALLRVKSTADPHTGKAKTVAVIDAEVETDLGVQDCQEVLLTISQKRAALRAMADSLEDRKDMLIQIAAKHRQEAGDYR